MEVWEPNINCSHRHPWHLQGSHNCWENTWTKARSYRLTDCFPQTSLLWNTNFSQWSLISAHRDRSFTVLLSASSFPKCLPQLGLGQGQGQKGGTGPSQRRQKFHYLSHHPCLPESTLTGKWFQDPKAVPHPSYSSKFTFCWIGCHFPFCILVILVKFYWLGKRHGAVC